MKNLIFLLIGLATALPFMNAQNTTIDLDLEEITSIGLSLDAVITLSEGSTQKISIEGPEDLIDDINTDVRNGSWNIKYETYNNNKVNDQLKIEIQVKTLTHLAISGGGIYKVKRKI